MKVVDINAKNALLAVDLQQKIHKKTIEMKQFLLSAVLLFAGCAAMAGNKISGMVVDDSTNEKLEAATVALIDENGKMLLGTTTGGDGKFELKGVENGSYLMRVSYLGYGETSLSLSNLSRDLNIGEVRMVASSAILGEVVVEGSPVVRKIDRQVILPTDAQKKASTNGVSLLQHLQVGNIVVNTIDKSITTGYGDAVQLRINGIEATSDEVVALRPEDVVRVEYHDNPGLRYGNVSAVVDYIVKKKESGGNVAGDFTNGVNLLGFGDYNLNAKYNYNKSSVGVVASWERRDLEWNRENYETFNYPDRVLENTEVGFPTKVKYDNLNTSLNYNYAGSRSMLNIALRNQYSNTPNSPSDRKSLLYQDEKTYAIGDFQKSKTVIPSLDIYYQLNLKNDQYLYVDLVGTYLNSRVSRSYSMTEEGEIPAVVLSSTDGDKYSLIGELIYERNLKSGKLNMGMKHTQSHVSNTYDGDISSKVEMNTAESYLFAEYQGGLKKVNYTVGIGVMRTYNEQERATQEKYIFRPSLTISYNAPANIFMRYNAFMSGYSPSLSGLSDVEQIIDAYQIRRGNPQLKSVTFFSNSMSASWRRRLVSIELFGRYSYDHKPIMEETLYENGKFVRTSANQRGFHRLNLSATVQVAPSWLNYLSVSVTPFFNRYISYGNNYTHTYSNFGLRGSIMGMYKNWSAMVQMNTSYQDLWGETITKDEKEHSIAIGYNRDKWSVQAMIVNPFTKKYDNENVNLSGLASSRYVCYTKNFTRALMINVSFNLDFGKNHRESGKRINNSDTDTGILSGTK